MSTDTVANQIVLDFHHEHQACEKGADELLMLRIPLSEHAHTCHLAVDPGAGLPAARAPPGPRPAPPDAGLSLRGSSAAAMARSRSATYCPSSASTACGEGHQVHKADRYTG